MFENLKAVLTEAHADFSRVVKATVYLTDLADFQTLNAIYAEYFGDHKPARTTVGVAQLPRGSQVEIDLIACRGWRGDPILMSSRGVARDPAAVGPPPHAQVLRYA